jgi:hypothetical protein
VRKKLIEGLHRHGDGFLPYFGVLEFLCAAVVASVPFVFVLDSGCLSVEMKMFCEEFERKNVLI